MEWRGSRSKPRDHEGRTRKRRAPIGTRRTAMGMRPTGEFNRGESERLRHEKPAGVALFGDKKAPAQRRRRRGGGAEERGRQRRRDRAGRPRRSRTAQSETAQSNRRSRAAAQAQPAQPSLAIATRAGQRDSHKQSVARLRHNQRKSQAQQCSLTGAVHTGQSGDAVTTRTIATGQSQPASLSRRRHIRPKSRRLGRISVGIGPHPGVKRHQSRICQRGSPVRRLRSSPVWRIIRSASRNQHAAGRHRRVTIIGGRIGK